jgi:hypothetical protein
VLAIADAGPVFCTLRSACGDGTNVVSVEALFSESESCVAVDTVAVLEKLLPAGVAGGILTTTVKFATDPAGNDAIVQVIVPFVPGEGFEQLNAGPLF